MITKPLTVYTERNQMKIDKAIVGGILGTLLDRDESILQGNQYTQFKEIVSHLVNDLNNLDEISGQIDYLEANKIQSDNKHDKEVEEIEDEMIRLQADCPHYSCIDADSPTATKLVICTICGKLMEKEITNDSES